MGFFSKLFGKKENTPAPKQEVKAAGSTSVSAAAAAMAHPAKSLDELAAEKDARPAVTEAELMTYFADYFAPNKAFYSNPASDQSKIYFGAVNAAREEMLKNPDLFKMATKWDIAKLQEMLQNPKPAVTNMLVCGLIFRTGDYGVLRSSTYCVDFCEKIPHCIALYLLLNAEKLPEDKHRMIIDAGDRSDKTAFRAAMESLKVLDPNWSFIIV